MKKTFPINTELSLFEKIFFDHEYDIKKKIIIRTNFQYIVVLLCVIEAVSVFLALA